MSKALSLDLRVQILEVTTEGLSHHAAAARFGVSAASVSRWRRRAHVEGDTRPRALGGERRSGRIEAHRALILDVPAETSDSTIKELRRLLTGRGLDFGYGTIQGFLIRHQMTREKKTGHASERDLPDALEHRQVWQASQTALKGRRLRMSQPYSHWKTSTFVAGLTLGGMIAPFVRDGPINRPASRPMSRGCWLPNRERATSSSWTICPATRGIGAGKRSGQPVPSSCPSRPTALTST